jgi:hypothetical protein
MIMPWRAPELFVRKIIEERLLDWSSIICGETAWVCLGVDAQ